MPGFRQPPSMALRSFKRFSAVITCIISKLCTVVEALMTKASLPAASGSRSTEFALQLPSSIQQIAPDADDYEVAETHEVPTQITNNPLWHRLSTHQKDVIILCSTDLVTAVLVVLQKTGIKLVLKAWSAERVSYAARETEAELDAAHVLDWNPLLATTVAACFDENGNYCSVTPYAGCSLDCLIMHPDWYTIVGQQDRLEFVKLLLPQWLQAFDTMQKTDVGYFHCDVKPGNLILDAATGLSSIIDFGAVTLANKEDYRPSYTPGYFTPEMVDPSGMFITFRTTELLKQAINRTTDVFLASYSALEIAVGLQDLPWKLEQQHYDLQTGKGYVDLLTAHADAAAAGYDALLARVACPIARDFFAKTMCCDPTQRLTPAQALQHPWLADAAAVVQGIAAAVAPIHQQHNQQLVELFSTVPGVILPQEQEQQQEGGQFEINAHQQQQEEKQSLDSHVHTASCEQQIQSVAHPESCCASAQATMPVALASCTSPGSSSSESSGCSTTSGDTTELDQLPSAHTVIIQTATAAKKPNLLQRGKSIVSKLSATRSNKAVKIVAVCQVENTSTCGTSRSSSPAGSLDVPCSPITSSSSSDSGSSSGASSAGQGDITIAAVDQQVPAGTEYTTSPKKSRLLGRSRRLLLKASQKLSTSRSAQVIKESPTCSSPAAADLASNNPTGPVTVQVQTWVDDDMARVKLPGLCGFRWVR